MEMLNTSNAMKCLFCKRLVDCRLHYEYCCSSTCYYKWEDNIKKINKQIINLKLKIGEMEDRPPNYGPCGHCGKDVTHWYPWFSCGGILPAYHEDCYWESHIEEE